MTFVSLNGRAAVSAAALVFYVVANLVFDATSFMIDPDRLSADDVGLAGAMGTAALFLVVGLLVSAVIFLVWLNRAAWNLRALHPGAAFQFTPGWCVGWWFVPFANLVKPFQAVKEIWQFSEPDTIDGGSHAYGPPPTLLTTWWGCWIASGVISNVSSRIPDHGASTAIGFVATLFSFGAGVSLIIIMRTITANQQAAFERRQKAPILQDTLKHAADVNQAQPY